MSGGWFGRGLLGLVAAAPLLRISEAEAQTIVSAGAFVGVAFAETPRFEWGAELMAVRTFGSCSEPGGGVGPFLQFDMLGKSRPRFSFGAIGGTALEAQAALGGQLGLSFRFDPKQSLDLYSGLRFNLSNATIYAHQNWFALEHAYGLGVASRRFIDNWCPEVRWVPGRAFRDAESAPIELGVDAESDGICDRAREWERDARDEFASVAAFVQLATELCGAGAPASLVMRAQRAAEEEIVHARLCLQTAARFAGRPLSLGALSLTPRAPLFGVAALTRLAVESAVDGWIGEGAAAVRAQEFAARSNDRSISSIQRRIASEEQGHARLGEDVVRWAVMSGGAPVRRALRSAMLHAFARVPTASSASEGGRRERTRREILALV